MKSLLAILMLVTSVYAFADCTYKLKYDALLYEGYTLNYGEYLENALKDKGLVRTRGAFTFEVVPSFEVAPSGHFQIATAGFKLVDQSPRILTEVSSSKKCFTQMCAVSDAKKVLVDAIKDFAKKVSACQ